MKALKKYLPPDTLDKGQQIVSQTESDAQNFVRALPITSFISPIVICDMGKLFSDRIK